MSASAFRGCNSPYQFVSGNYSLFEGANANAMTWAQFYKNLWNIFKAVFVSSFICLMFNHPYFHLPHAIMFICIMLPFGSPCYSILFLRIGLASASIVQVLLAEKFQYWIDSIFWNSAFTVIHVIHIIMLFYQLKTIQFNDELEKVYMRLFCPLKVSREQFKKVISCTNIIQSLEHREKFDKGKLISADSLSLVLSGKLLISKNGIIQYIVLPYQFLDSHEWFGVSVGEFSQVSVTAVEDCRVLLWHRNELRSTLFTDNFLNSVFNSILCRDIVKKLEKTTSKTMPNCHFPNPFHERVCETKINMYDEVQALLHFDEDIDTILKQELKDSRRLSDIMESDEETTDV